LNPTIQYAQRLPWDAPFGIVTCTINDFDALRQAVDSRMKSHGRLQTEAVTRRAAAFDSYFADQGLRSPLSGQIEMVRSKGLPSGSVLVQALLLSEISTGLLMGAQDASAVKGALVCDRARSGESFRGMRREVQCRPDEIVLRDDEGIIASLLQGPDHRTRLTPETKDVVFFVFSVPGIVAADIQEGTEAVRSLLADSCSEIQARVCP
jgi:hypothetical protein